MTESPFSTQGWNRYSYVGNSPLNFTDPSGYCFLGCFWKPIFAAISNALTSVPWLGSVLQLAATVLICGPAAPLCAAVVATIASTAIAGITSGNLGAALRAGIITAFTAGAFFAAGELTGNFSGTQTPGNGHGVLQFGSDAHLFNIAAHATVGCAASVASGGRCGSGALSGAVGSFAGPLLKDLAFGPKLVATSVLGGLSSMAGGGSFGNGAVTAAFGYLFNECGGDCWKRAAKEAAQMTIDWASGTGPSERTFGTGSDQANDMMDAKGVNLARNYFYEKNVGNIANADPLVGVDNWRVSFGLRDLLWDAGISPTQQFVGSFRVDITPIASEEGTYLMFKLSNNSSLQSLLYGIGPAYERSTFPLGGNMRQSYWWLERMR